MATDIILTTMFVFHIAIWLFVIFGGFISPLVCQINILVIVPFIYLIHILPLHVIVETKMKRLYKNYDQYKNVPEYAVDERQMIMLKKYLPSDIDNEKVLKIIRVYLAEEDKLVIPRLHRKLESYFEKSFGSPVSAQGMLILAMIVSTYLLKFYWKSF